MKPKTAQFLLMFLLMFLLGSLLVLAQVASTPNPVKGYFGSAEIAPTADGARTVVVFTPKDSDMIAYVVQYGEAKAPFMRSWSGSVHLLVSHGILAAVGKDGTKLMFKFPEVAVPGSLESAIFEQYDIVGISVYGSFSPEQLSSLKRSGTCGSRPGVGNSCAQLTCTSGGQGASQCSAGGSGGCSVTCTTGYNACCNVNVNQCCCQK